MGAPGHVTVVDMMVERAQADPSAFEDIYRQHVAYVYGIALRYGRRGADADDVVSETFVRALAHLKGFHQLREKGFGVWLGTIARHIMIDQGRRNRFASDLCVDDLAGELEDRRYNVEDIAAQRDLLRRIWTMIDNMAPKTREAMILRWARDMSYDEIARETGQSRSAVESILHRGLSALRFAFDYQPSRRWRQ